MYQHVGSLSSTQWCTVCGSQMLLCGQLFRVMGSSFMPAQLTAGSSMPCYSCFHPYTNGSLIADWFWVSWVIHCSMCQHLEVIFSCTLFFQSHTTIVKAFHSHVTTLMPFFTHIQPSRGLSHSHTTTMRSCSLTRDHREVFLTHTRPLWGLSHSHTTTVRSFSLTHDHREVFLTHTWPLWGLSHSHTTTMRSFSLTLGHCEVFLTHTWPQWGLETCYRNNSRVCAAVHSSSFTFFVHSKW